MSGWIVEALLRKSTAKLVVKWLPKGWTESTRQHLVMVALTLLLFSYGQHFRPESISSWVSWTLQEINILYMHKKIPAPPQAHTHSLHKTKTGVRRPFIQLLEERAESLCITWAQSGITNTCSRKGWVPDFGTARKWCHPFQNEAVSVRPYRQVAMRLSTVSRSGGPSLGPIYCYTYGDSWGKCHVCQK